VFGKYLGTVVLLLTFAVLLSIGTAGSAQAYDAHSPILILNNASLVSAGLPGTGTEADPFLIQNYEIDGAGGSAIAIYYTDLHVKIRNCLLSGSSWPSAAIHLENVQNVTIENNRLVDSYIGVGLVMSNDIVVRNNSFENHNTGMLLDNSDNNVLFNNTCVLDIEWPSGKLGIQLISSDHNRLEKNNCSGNNVGIELRSSNFNALVANTCDDNDGDGIAIESSINNTVTANICRGNSIGGIVLYSSSSVTTGNEITYNTCSGNALTSKWGAGIFLSSSTTYPVSSNNISDNELINNYHGMWALNSASNNIAFNTVHGNQVSGIYLSSTSNCIVSSNTIYDNDDSGIWLHGSSGCTVEYNTAWNNFNGTYLYDSDDNVISHNELQGNTYGIYLSSSSYNTINDNNCSDSVGGDGIQLRSSDFNKLLNNIANDNVGWRGIFLFTSISNVLLSNTCNGNSDGISTYSTTIEFSNYNVIHNNTCSWNTNDGIRVQDRGSFTKITNNTCNFNANRGMEISASPYCTAANNTCLGNTIGIWFKNESDRNLIDNNNCSENSLAGLYLTDSYSNVVSNNTCIQNAQYGMRLDISNENMITENDCHDNFHGIYLYESYWNDIRGNNCTSPGLFYLQTNGIFLEYSDDNSLIGNNCTHNGNGIRIKDCERIEIIDNLCSNSDNYGGDQIGIFLQYVYGSTISNNTCVDNSIGICVIGSDYNRLSGNNCSNNVQAGIKFYTPSGDSNYNLLCNNTCSDNGYGMWLSSLSYSTICNNTCTDNGKAGIHVEYRSMNNLIANNTITNNGYQLVDDGYGMSSAGIGLAIDGSGEYNWCEGNVISNNTIGGSRLYGISILNSANNWIFGNVLSGNNNATSVYDPRWVQAYDDGSNHWNATGHGNLWADRTSPDDDWDGIVDEAYVIDGGEAKDCLPLSISVAILSPTDGFVTKDDSVGIQGNAVSYFGAAQVTWYNAATGESGVCNGTEAWTATVVLAEGANLITVTMTDLSGIEKNDTVSVVLDTTPPSLVITSPVNGSYAETSVTVTWTGSDAGAGISHYEVSIEGVGWNITTGNSYTFTGLADGEYVILVTAYDTIGNYVEWTVSVTVDTVPPSVNITSPADGLPNTTGSITVSWTGSDASGIDHYEVSWEGGSPVSLPSSADSFTFALSDGSHLLTVVAFDLAGRSSSDQVAVIVDSQAPSLTITSPAEGSYVANSDVTVIWAASDAGSGVAYYTVSIEGLLSINTTENSYTINDLDDGFYTVLVSAYDEFDNCKDEVVTFTVDTATPTATVSPTGDLAPLSPLIVVEFSEAMNQTSVEIMVDGVEGSVDWSGNTATLTLSQRLAYGTAYNVTVTGKDLAGNPMTVSWTFSTLSVGNVQGKLVDEDGDPMEGIEVRLSNGDTVTTDSQGNFLFEQVGVGNYTLTVEADGYEVLSMGVEVEADGTTDLGELTLVSTDGGGENGGTPWAMLIAILAIIAVVAVAAVVYLKKK
jgi:parallel beta-helix repeat protein